ncbi:acetyl-CoA C-acetyltransferase [Primorskyibacter sedentarius]|uniref:Acetyl-CoA C-acetyltransferase n=1 Tax=Primorskyibacter sedentarius TaxID=745311 RepID=A0A4R3IU84_9RHOB|nr:thiolase family protein [Primorskyibacter sedentarius]TCS53964.1 acetyl-CoA C-acetyltransferase [Primorskyibacter sedentarius]
MTRAVIVAARRSAVAPRGGALSHLDLHALAKPVIAACLSDIGQTPEAVDELIMGNALGAGGNPARVAALAAGLPMRVAGLSIDRQCCSGLDAIRLAQAMILSGQAETIIAGGAESYSRRPVRLTAARAGIPPREYDQPPFTPWPDRDPDMAEAADALARHLSISRAAQDGWTVASHAKALAARAELATEIVGTEADSYTRKMTERLCARAPVIVGSISRANTAAAADAAAFCVITSETRARHLGLPYVAILGGAVAGGDPMLPGLAPVAAIKDSLNLLGLAPSQLSASEIMEAFAVQAIACVEQAGLDPATVNRKGGALARGHSIGASGAILAVRLFHDLRADGGLGLAAIAAAGGIGTALVLGAGD